MKQKKNCFRDVARALQDQLGDYVQLDEPHGEHLGETVADSPVPPPSDVTPAAVADGPWDKSMGMRHPDRPCMDRARHPGGCGPDRRSPEQIASDPFDTNNPVSLAARERVAAGLSPEDTNEVPHGKVRCICAGFGCITLCGHCEGIGAGTTPCQICALADGKLKC